MDQDLLDDLDELDGIGGGGTMGDGDGGDGGDDGDVMNGGSRMAVDQGENGGSDDGEDEDDEDDIEDKDQRALEKQLMAAGKVTDVKAIAKLLSNKNVKEVLAKMEEFKKRPRTAADNVGPVEEDPEYHVLVQANNMMFDLDTEILMVHKFIRDHYAPRFPELESLIPNALDYARIVKAIGNEMDVLKVDLKSILPQATVMIVTVIATTTNGKPLPEDELARVMEACDMALQLESTKIAILEYVESRMSFIAPNLAAIIGSTTAAKIMGLAGGLAALSKIPACNLLVLGKAGKGGDSGGVFAKGQLKHAGFIYYSEMVQAVPKEFRIKASRMVAAKCVLAARVDRARESQDGRQGHIFRDDITKKLEKVQEPPSLKNVKALPVPQEGRKSRRAGRKLRRLKERFAVTEAQKQQNRVKFGEAEEEVLVGDTVEGLGLLGGQTGKIRGIQADKNKKLGMGKKHQQQHRALTGSSGIQTSGLSTSLAFTPVQGIELENPEILAQRKRALQEEGDKYFGSSKKRDISASAQGMMLPPAPKKR